MKLLGQTQEAVSEDPLAEAPPVTGVSAHTKFPEHSLLPQVEVELDTFLNQ